tara:strand:+ start:209 stop:631 length:423 start_codon:yes stop_codon:yes gene_type:complete
MWTRRPFSGRDVPLIGTSVTVGGQKCSTWACYAIVLLSLLALVGVTLGVVAAEVAILNGAQRELLAPSAPPPASARLVESAQASARSAAVECSDRGGWLPDGARLPARHCALLATRENCADAGLPYIASACEASCGVCNG